MLSQHRPNAVPLMLEVTYFCPKSHVTEDPAEEGKPLVIWLEVQHFLTRGGA